MKIILVENIVIDVMPDSFTLAPTDTDVSIMSWTGAEPSLGQVFNGTGFVDRWDAISTEAKLSMVRNTRDCLFSNTDFMVSRHMEQEARAIPTTFAPAQYNELLAYRQALRDFTETVDLNVGSFDAIVWPTVPSFI